MQRSRDENVLLLLSSIGALGITPFAIYRFMQGDLLAGIVDSLIVIIVTSIFIYVYRTGNVRIPAIIMTISYMSVMVAVNYIIGPSLIYWAFPTMGAAYFLVKPNEGAVINAVALIALLPALMLGTSTLQMVGLLITLTLNNAFAYIYAKYSLQYQETLAKLATIDDLTGVGNRASFVKDMTRAIAERKRYGNVVSLIMMDIDHFKKINDEHGHLEGDSVLVNLMKLCKERIRGVDQIYRIGGEEFAIMASGAEATGARHFAEDIRRKVEKATLSKNINVTISIGIAECSATDSLESLISRADTALYQAKNLGRNKVCIEYEPSAERIVKAVPRT